MPWSEADRVKYAVIRERYSSDLSDGEFALIFPLLPARKRRGRKPTCAREILNAVFYLIRSGCPWRLLPKDFPPFTTVQNRFYAWRDSGLWTQIVCVLVMRAREAEGREAAPRRSSSIASGQDNGGGRPRGFTRQENQGSQATRRRRYAWPVNRMPDHVRRCPRSRRSGAAFARDASQEPVRDDVFRRFRLQRR